MELKDESIVTPAKLADAVRLKEGPFEHGNDMGCELAYMLFDKLVEAISSKDIVFSCVNSSMTSRIRNAMGLNEVDRWGDAPRPNNFRVDEADRSILFDFPDTYTCKNGRVLHFETVMADIFETAAGPGDPLCDRSVRRLRPTRLRRASWDTDSGSLLLEFGLSDKFTGDHEWLDFIVADRYTLEELARWDNENEKNTDNEEEK